MAELNHNADVITVEELSYWEKLARQLSQIKTEEITLRKRIFEVMFPDAGEGTNTHPLANDYVLKASYPFTRDIDEGALAAMQDELKAANVPMDTLVKYKPTLSKSTYNKLTEEQRKLVDQFIICRPGSPALEISLPKRKPNFTSTGHLAL